MELGIIGLGRMGSGMARRLSNSGHRVVVYDPLIETVSRAVEHGAVGSMSIGDLVGKLARPCAVWIMVPSGEVTEATIIQLAAVLSAGDIIVDGGNSNYKDSIRRAVVLAGREIILLDVGTSGGIWGLEDGYCLTVGGDSEGYRRLEPVFRALALSGDRGYGHVGPSGAGHFVKMVHNGIEYGLMQAYAEGFELMQAKKEFKLDLTRIAGIWCDGSVIRSWLLDLAVMALQEDPDLKNIEAYIDDSGEGRWALEEAIELAVPVPVIAQSLMVRFHSRQAQPFAARLVSALRNQFGGHPVKKVE